MRVRVTVEADPMTAGARASLRVYAVAELHRTLHGHTAWIDAVEVVCRRDRGTTPRWRVEVEVSLWDGARFDAHATAPRPHAAVDEVAHAAWAGVRHRVRIGAATTPTPAAASS